MSTYNLRLEATNTFKDGMNLDVPEMSMPNSAYSSALNATFATGDGNEGALLNDMGNSKIYYIDDNGNKLEVCLTEGFVPVGVKEFGGILYIASVNPSLISENGLMLSELGTFPSPDYSLDELGNFINLEGKLLNKYLPLHNLKIDGYLSEFKTPYLNFDLNTLETIIILECGLDGSVNLLLTDYKNGPRLINSMFSVHEGHTYKITTHLGDNNTNIYKCTNETLFNLYVGLQKQTSKLPKIKFNGVDSGGLLLVGGYVIYIKACDEEGNSTDVIAESGIIPVFLGTDGDPKSMNGGYGDLRTDKSIKLTIYNLDSCYSHISVLYSRVSTTVNSGNSLGANAPICHLIIDPYELSTIKVDGKDEWGVELIITGFERGSGLKEVVDESIINLNYEIIDSPRTAAVSLNITFLGNFKIKESNYEKLRDLSLHIWPLLVTTDFETLTKTEKIDLQEFSGTGYYASKNTYYYTGYHNEELYRFGVVYIFMNGSRSTVYNVLGIQELGLGFAPTGNQSRNAALLNMIKDPNTKYTLLDSDSNYISNFGAPVDNHRDTNKPSLNRRGVCRIKGDWNPWNIHGIKFNVSEKVKEELKNLGVIGMFFVRLKRRPLRLMLAFTTPIIENTFTPAIKYGPRMYAKAYFPDKAAGVHEGKKNPEWDFYSTYLTETCYKNVFDKTNRDIDIGDLNNKELRIHFPKIGDFLGTRSMSTMNRWWNLTLDYNLRMLPFTNYGLVYSNHSYFDFSNTSKTNDSCSVNGPYVTYDGKSPGLFGRLPLTNLLQRGAYACFSPEFELDLPTYNNFFAGLEFNIKIIKYEDVKKAIQSKSKINSVLHRSAQSERVYYDSTNNYEVKKAVTSNSSEHDEFFKVKLIAVGDSTSLMGILRDATSIESKEYVTRENVNELPYYKYRDTVYFSTKVGDPTESYGFKEAGGDRVSLFAPTIKYSGDLLYYNSDGKIESHDNLYIYDKDDKNKDGQTFDEPDKDHPNNKGKHSFKYFNKSGQSDEWFSYPHNKLGGPANLIRGEFGPYIGLYISNELLNRFYTKQSGETEHFADTIRTSTLENAVINIYIPGYLESNMSEYVNVRMSDTGDYYAISELVEIDSISSVECYRGDCYASSCSHRLNRNFLDPNAPNNDIVVLSNSFLHYLKNGETEIKAMSYYDKNEIKDDGKDRTMLTVSGLLKGSSPDSTKSKCLTNPGDLNAILLGSWINFTLNTTMNVALRSEDRSWPGEKLQMGLYRSFFPLSGVNIGGLGKIPESFIYDKGFSISGGVRRYKWGGSLEDIYVNTYYKNRIAYSEVSDSKNRGGIINFQRVFKEGNKVDYDGLYGSIVKLLNYGENILCIMEHGVGMIAVKPRVTAGDQSTIYFHSKDALDDRLSMLSEKFGTTWESSILQTPYSVYGIDVYAKKVWAVRGNLLLVISDYNIESFLNDNLNLTLDKYELGKICIRSHYNSAKKDVIFTCYQYLEEDNENVLWSICYNEAGGGLWITFYSWIPEFSENIGNNFITFDHSQVRKIINNNDNKLLLWKHGSSSFIANTDYILPTNWYGKTRPFEVEFIVTESNDVYKIFSDLRILSNKAEPESFHYYINGESYENLLDKPNLYYRLEKTKELWHRAGADILFDPNYKQIHTCLKPLWNYRNELYNVVNPNVFVKSVVPWNYYNKSLNPEEIEQYYHMASKAGYNYLYLTGTEITRNDRLLLLGLAVHALGTNISGPGGVLRGNMKYVGDTWYVQINPILFKEKNEPKWDTPPIVFHNAPIPEEVDDSKINKAALEMGLTTKDFDFTDWGERKGLKLRDKYIRIRIRYSGKDKVILLGIKTLYNINLV